MTGKVIPPMIIMEVNQFLTEISTAMQVATEAANQFVEEWEKHFQIMQEEDIARGEIANNIDDDAPQT